MLPAGLWRTVRRLRRCLTTLVGQRVLLWQASPITLVQKWPVKVTWNVRAVQGSEHTHREANVNLQESFVLRALKLVVLFRSGCKPTHFQTIVSWQPLQTQLLQIVTGLLTSTLMLREKSNTQQQQLTHQLKLPNSSVTFREQHRQIWLQQMASLWIQLLVDYSKVLLKLQRLVQSGFRVRIFSTRFRPTARTQ